MPLSFVWAKYLPSLIVACSWHSFGSLQNRASWCTAIDISGLELFCRYVSIPTAVLYFHDNLRGFPARSLLRRGFPTGATLALQSMPNSLFSRPSKFTIHSVRYGFDSSNLFLVICFISMPRNLFILPSSTIKWIIIERRGNNNKKIMQLSNRAASVLRFCSCNAPV